MKDGKVIVGGSLLILGGYGLYRLLKKPPPEYGKKGGDPVSATIRFMHGGYGGRVWIGFGIGPGHQDPVTMTTDRWIGGFFDVARHEEPIAREVEVEGIFPYGLRVGDWIDTLKIILPYPINPTLSPLTASQHDLRYDSDWDDEVYTVLE